VSQFWKILAEDEADIVFGKRMRRDDDKISKFFASAFWWFYRKLVFADVPPGGVDVFAINDRVKHALLEINEPNSSLVAQLMWLGFRREFVPYERRPRRSGHSAWTFRRKIDYMLDSVVGFTDLPIMFQLWIGAFGLVVSMVVGAVVLLARLLGWITVGGYTPIMLMLAFGFSVLLVSQGILGLYLWRSFENSKRRPLAVVSEHLKFEGSTK
jgi:hypothetical protein